ncbi:DUF4038 domain-containing protein [Paenibacillus sp. HB172176]|uniref:apiosidase-like domain-containing protein n=1 Tax=Paenibacillus sp. HB172176 TaxID=2493690 RepID=UPI00143C3F9F|nr:DUF4038 domain-containing protein [Paenibacillus sp. HB172176]
MNRQNNLMKHASALFRASSWRRFELTLAAQNDYDNPYSDVEVEVVFTRPGVQSIHTWAYWDGEERFAATIAFPSPGKWSYRTSCSHTEDAGLHAQIGEVEVEAVLPDEPNALYRCGMLKPSGNGRYLQHADGEPFFWLGDTVWPAFFRAKEAEWLAYIQDRAAKGFNVVQVCLNWGGGRASDMDGNEARLLEGGERWNPAFYQGVQKKIRIANDYGLVVLLNGLYCPKGRLTEGDSIVSYENYEHYGRMLAARFNGSFVIYSPSFDAPYHEACDRQGEAIRTVTSRHLITQHPNTSPAGTAVPATEESYFEQPYLSFSMCQTGHHNGNRELVLREAEEWIRGLARKLPPKPVVNGEAFYDAGGMTPNHHPKYQGTDRDSRAAGYLSLLSGACGYTYGAYGLWNWELDPGVSHRAAMNFPSSEHMAVLARIFRSFRWWELEPASERIVHNPEAAQLRMALASSGDESLLVAYMPDQSEIDILLTIAESDSCKAAFLDPISGERHQAAAVTRSGQRLKVRAERRSEWVLLVQVGRG